MESEGYTISVDTLNKWDEIHSKYYDSLDLDTALKDAENNKELTIVYKEGVEIKRFPANKPKI